MSEVKIQKRLEGLTEEEFFKLVKEGLEIFSAIHHIRGDWRGQV